MDEETFDEALRVVEDATNRRDTVGLLSSIATSLVILADSHAKMLRLAVEDDQQAFDDAVGTRAKELADEMVSDQTKRTFIGKK